MSLDYSAKHSEPIHSTTGTDVDVKPDSTSGPSVARGQGTIEGNVKDQQTYGNLCLSIF
jgi:hypothetical protein